MTQLGRILVIGATGHVGRHVVAQAVGAGVKVRVMVRDPGKALVPPGVDVVRGDLADPASMEASLLHVDAVFLMWPFLTGDGATEVLDVIKRHAARVVYLSAAGVDLDLDRQRNPIFEFHAALERAVTATGLEWVILRPYSFASNNLGWAARWRTGVVRAAGGAEVRSVIHEADIAAVAVRALLDDGLIGTRPELSGPEALTTEEQAVAIGEALGLPVRFEEIGQAEAREQAVAAGYPDDLVEALFDGAGTFAVQPVTSRVEEITGQAPRSIRQWALDHAEAFR
ncbi:SDR family oxidoreductase [Amycolatopsis sp. NPDC059657]|uniref:SDR family oxidoreductase n=1 Tax=Amycolatopsis sp. NPDC059657 TaxID=3346899 RepID=UPI00366DA2B0